MGKNRREGGPYLTGSRPIALAVLRYMTPNAVGLLPLSGRTHREKRLDVGVYR